MTMDESADKTIESARTVADTLDQRGHAEHADKLRAALRHSPFSAMRHALREACQVVLTAIEAIDPVCATLVKELRLKVDARLE